MENEKVLESSRKHTTGDNFTVFGTVLLVIGVVAMIVFGLTVARFAVYDMELKTSGCRVISTEVASDRMNCSCTNDRPSFISAKSTYPCLQIKVALYVNGEEHIAYLYENSNREKNKCSTQPCDYEDFYNDGNVTVFWINYGGVNDTYTCYYNPKNLKEAFTQRLLKSDRMKLMHSFLWPGIVFAIGIVLLGIGFCRDKGYCYCRKRNESSSSVPYQDLSSIA